ncbi:MAG: Lrp/AsnC family transcriptional regulator [Alphaproteobacteria bacterium]|nr:MAG: Lrp/AsnC family transcriptional regulator [Alphaproteobacteria bacterium]
MSVTPDQHDLRILRQLQRDASQPLERLADAVGLSRNAVWRRVRALEDAGIIRARVAVLDAERMGLGVSVFVAVRAARHDADWHARFVRAVRAIPSIVGAWRTSGELDYLLHARLADVRAYDALYQRLIEKVEIADVSASFVMEAIKETSEIPI